ncbi:MAG: F0F1 ATP synthase subunit B [Candidatus Magasanikbacteria bacterium]|nr:F0F1 ATP synthase subunit B [Candidatus Magasanikbacteria bacterium]
MLFTPTAYASPQELVPRASEAPADSGVFASLGINAQSLVFQLINFAIVAAIIWRLILKPLTKKMAERQKLIDESLTNAKKVETNLQRSEQKYQERIDQAKVAANKILEKTTTEADQLSAQLKEKAKKEIGLLVDQAKRNIKIERAEMMADIKTEAANLVVAAVEKILTEKVDSKKDKELVEEMVAGLKLKI